MQLDKDKNLHIVGQVASVDADQMRGTLSDTGLRLLLACAFQADGEWISFSRPEIVTRFLRCTPGQIPQTLREWLSQIHPDDAAERRRKIMRLSWDGARYQLRYPLRTRDGRKIWIEETGQRDAGTNQTATCISGVFRDVTKEETARQRAGFLEQYDDLTGLLNESTFINQCRQAHATAKRCGFRLTLLRFRINNLEDIQTIYGFETGDRLLKSFSYRLEQVFRAPDFVARFSETEFGVALTGAGSSDLENVSERLQTALMDTPYKSPHGPLYVELVCAASEAGGQDRSIVQTLAETAIALEHCRDEWNICVFDQAMGQAHMTSRQSDIEVEDVLDALNGRQISLAFQPIVDAKSRELHHYECLLRLRRDDGEVVSAGGFIMAAEKLGLVHLLDRRALEIASETLRQDLKIQLALNVSAGTIQNRETAQAYIDALRALGPAAQRVTLEMTETVALEDPAMASAFSAETRGLGCKFAVDDFGSGYTTFRNLMSIEADTIKIDGSFVQDISTEPHKETFVRMMVDLAQTFGVKTVAEMVETRADAELLKRLGVDYLQGYLFGVPSEAPAWVKLRAS